MENDISSIRRAIAWYERFLDSSFKKKPKKKKPRTAPVDQSSSVTRGGASLSQSSGGDLADPQPFEFVEPMSSGTSSSAAYGGGASSSAMASVARGGADPVPSFMAPVVQSSSGGSGGTMVDSKSCGTLYLFVVKLWLCSLSHIHIFVVILVTNQGTKTTGLNEEELAMSLPKNGRVSRTGDHFRRERGGGAGNNRAAILGGTLVTHCYKQSKLVVGDDKDKIIYPIEDSPFAVLDVCRARFGFYWVVNEENVNYLADQFHIMVNRWKDRQSQMESNLRDFQLDIVKVTTTSRHKICIALAPVGVDYTEDVIAGLIFNPSKRGSLVIFCGHGGCYVQLDADSQLTDPSRCVEHQLCIECNVNPVNFVRLSLCSDCHTQQQSQQLCRMSHVDQCSNTVSSSYAFIYCSSKCKLASRKLSWCKATDCNHLQDFSPNTVVPKEKYHSSYTQTSEYINAGGFTSYGRGVFCTLHWQDKAFRICRWCGTAMATIGWQCFPCKSKLKAADRQKKFNARLPTIDE